VSLPEKKQNKTKFSSELGFSSFFRHTNIKDTQGATACALPLQLSSNLFSVFIPDFLFFSYFLGWLVGLYPNPRPRTAAKSSIKRV